MNSCLSGRSGLSFAAALAGFTLAGAAFGQASPGTDAPPPLYRVEVIVFAHNASDPAEEDFAHIARRAAAEEGRRGREIATFDFEPYLDEDPLDADADADAGAASGESVLDTADTRLLRGPDDSRAADDGRVADANLERGEPLSPAVPQDDRDAPADASGGLPQGAVEDGTGLAAEPEPIDPFGGRLGDTVAGFRFRLLEADELELTSTRRRIENRNAYTPLVHGGWIQEGLPPADAKPFNLAYLGTSNPSGTVRLHVSRFLHVTVDLGYRGPGSAARAGLDPGTAEDAVPGGAAEVPAFQRFGAPAPLDAIDVSPRYRLRAERRVGRGELHYFDHPLFGVIVLVQPYEPPAPPESGGVRPAA